MFLRKRSFLAKRSPSERKARRPRRFGERPLAVESLESRRVMAGNVLARVVNGDLVIDGDAQSNQILVRQVNATTMVVSPLDSTTTVNGSRNAFGARGVRDDLTIRMGDGDDVVQIQGYLTSPVNIPGSLYVDMGAGNDSLTVARAFVLRTTSLLLGAGRDTAFVTGSTFLGRFSLNMGDGNDGATVRTSTFFSQASVNGGDGVDGLIRSSNRFLNPFFRNLIVSSVEGALPGGGPTANPDGATVAEDDSTIINVASNDTASEGTLDLTSIVITQAPANGTATVNPDGTVTYDNNGAEAASDTFRYTIKDSLGNVSNAALVTIAVTPVNDAPTANDDTDSVNEGAQKVLAVLANDVDPEGQFDLDSIVVTDGPSNGSVQVNANGTVTYTHDGSETTSDSFSYTVLDAAGEISNEATVSLTIVPVNDAPVAGDNSLTVAEGALAVVDVAANDTDVDSTINLSSIVIVSGPANGTAVPALDGTITYTHNGSETLTDSFTYTIKDAQGLASNVATVSVTITPVNDAPTAAVDNASVDAGESVTIDVASNDADPEGQLDLTSIEITDQPDNGSLLVNADGTVTYTHDGSATVSDSFSYTIKDAQGLPSNSATVTISIEQPQNDPPTAGNDTATVLQGDSVTIDLANNDSDPEGDLDLASIEIVTDPQFGLLVINGDGTVDYFNDGSDQTSDSFTYTIRDGQGNISNTATVNITIEPFDPPDNNPPNANDDEADITENAVAPVTGNVLDNDTDDDNDDLFVSSVEGDEGNVGQQVQGQFGTLVVNADGTYTYTLNNNNSEVDALNDGEELFEDLVYFVSDGIDESIAFITIRILGVTD